MPILPDEILVLCLAFNNFSKPPSLVNSNHPVNVGSPTTFMKKYHVVNLMTSFNSLGGNLYIISIRNTPDI